MIRVRFSAACALLSSGIVIASAAHGAPRCDQSMSRACRAAATQTSREADSGTAGERRVATTSGRRVSRHRHAVHHPRSAKTAHSDETAHSDQTAHSGEKEPVKASVAAHPPETSPAERRFSQFVSPRPLAVNPVEELRTPRINLTEFSGQTAYPVADSIDPKPADSMEKRAAPVQQIASEPEPAHVPLQNEGQNAGIAPRAEPSANASMTPVEASRPAERDVPERTTSWVRLVFLTWGGLLTVGSALRLLIG